MKIKMICGKVIGEREALILEYLAQCEDWPTVEEIMAATGIKHPTLVKNSLALIIQQMELYKSRQRFLKMLQEVRNSSPGDGDPGEDPESGV